MQCLIWDCLASASIPNLSLWCTDNLILWEVDVFPRLAVMPGCKKGGGMPVCSFTEHLYKPNIFVIAVQILTNQTAYHVALADKTHNFNAWSLMKPTEIWCLFKLTRIVVAVAYDEHEQQHRDDGCEKHPPYSRSNHSRVDVVAGFGCNTSQAHVAKQGRYSRCCTEQPL